MSFKKTYFYFFATIVISVGLYTGFKKVTNSSIDIKHSASDRVISAHAITLNYVDDEKEANHKFQNKIIEVHGIVKAITTTNQRNTIVLKGWQSDTNVICDLETQQINKPILIGTNLKIKGICKGFLKDVILLNCMILNNENNE